ncbi:MAG: DUF1460 domain-containing protein [Gemmatimonadota bacterium]
METAHAEAGATGSEGAASPSGAGGDRAGRATAAGSAPQAPVQQARIALSGTETEEDWRILLETVRQARAAGLDTVPMGDAVAAIGRTFVGEPYTPGTLEVGDREALVVNLREFDCVTFVENTLAIARTLRLTDSTDPEVLKRTFVGELAGLRYRGGSLNGYPSRLHYFSEWIADNAARGHLVPLTAELGGVVDPEPVRFMSTHPDAYRQMADPEVREAIVRIESSLGERTWIPQDRIAGIEERIKDGDVIAATSTVEGLDVAHTGIALHVDGRLHLMHAPLVGKSVEISELPLAERIRGIRGQDGIMVARPLEPR